MPTKTPSIIIFISRHCITTTHHWESNCSCHEICISQVLSLCIESEIRWTDGEKKVLWLNQFTDLAHVLNGDSHCFQWWPNIKTRLCKYVPRFINTVLHTCTMWVRTTPNLTTGTYKHSFYCFINKCDEIWPDFFVVLGLPALKSLFGRFRFKICCLHIFTPKPQISGVKIDPKSLNFFRSAAP